MQQEVLSFHDWQEFGFHVFDHEIPHQLVLSQTYKEWLKENPDGYTAALEKI